MKFDCKKLNEIFQINGPDYIEIDKIEGKSGCEGNLNSFYGKKHSDELKDKWSKERTGIAKSTVCCLYCRIEVGINIFPRWHGNNCKNAKY